MHIPKLLAVFCLAALGAFTLNAQRADTDAQAKAREQLRQAMQQLDAQQGAASNSVPAKPAPKPKKRPATVAPAPAESSPDSSNQDTEAKARQKLREAAAQLDAQQPQPPAAPAKPAPAPKTKVAKKPVETDKVAVVKPAPEPKKKAKVDKAAPVYPAEVAPSIAAAPGSKEQRLADLLQLYKSDKITPADYHEQRAKILSEP